MFSQQEAELEPDKNEDDRARAGDNPPRVKTRTSVGSGIDCGSLRVDVAAAIPRTYRSQESITPARHGFDESRILRRIAESVAQARETVRRMCVQLLANPNIEDYSFEVEPREAGSR